MIDRALNEDEDEDGLVKGSTSAAHDLGLPDQPLPMDGVSVLADDVLEPAGVVLSVFDGMVVVQGLEGPKALDESSVLCMEDRTIIGRIEEVFGPVAKPLYALRFAGKESALSSTQPGSKIFSVPRLCGFIPLDDLKAYRDRKGGEGLGGDDADEEEYFSDDDEEEAFTKVRSKRKADAIQTPAPNEARTSNVPRLRSTTPASHAAYHQPRSSSHFKAFATAGQMQSVSLSDGRSSEGRSRQGSIMSSQYAPPAQSSYQNGQNHSQMPYMMPQPFAPGSFVPTGYGTAPYHAAPPTMPPTQYLSVQHPLQPPHNSQYPRM